MKNHKWSIALISPILIFLAGCSFIGGVFKTGMGIGALVVIAIIVLILYISRSGKRNA